MTTTGIGSLQIAGTDNNEEFLQIDGGDNGQPEDLHHDLPNYADPQQNLNHQQQSYFQQHAADEQMRNSHDINIKFEDQSSAHSFEEGPAQQVDTNLFQEQKSKNTKK